MGHVAGWLAMHLVARVPREYMQHGYVFGFLSLTIFPFIMFPIDHFILRDGHTGWSLYLELGCVGS